jgi:hypothetical protein
MDLAFMLSLILCSDDAKGQEQEHKENWYTDASH